MMQKLLETLLVAGLRQTQHFRNYSTIWRTYWSSRALFNGERYFFYVFVPFPNYVTLSENSV